MIRKPAVFSGSRVVRAFGVLAILAASTGAFPQAADSQSPDQQTPAQQQPGTAQQPGTSQSGNEEATPEEATPRHKIKPKEYKNWNFNAEAGANVDSGQTKKFVRGGGATFGAGVARNYSKYFGFRLDAQFDDLPLRNTSFLLAQAPGGNNHVYTATLDPIINVPATRLWSGYVVFGPSYLHRSGKLDSSTTLPGSACNAFYIWWGRCYAGSLPLNVDLLHSSENQFGYNIGGGIARKVYNNVEVFVDFRIIHGTHRGITTDVRPITMGLRW